MIVNSKDEVVIDIDSDNGEFNFWLKWDGCCEIRRYYNGTRGNDKEDVDRIHICELKEFRDMLDEVIKIGEEHQFGI